VTPAEQVRVERLLPARPADVFEAWTDPERLRVWMGPGNTTVTRVECDLRVGGSFLIVMSVDGDLVDHTGRYRVVEPPRRLVFTWCSSATGGQDTVVTVDLAPAGSDTLMVLTHERLDEDARPAHRGGWESIADNLAAHVAAQRDAGQGGPRM
jgi:uncharacterized protein YndB with AHSA1/START domain